MEIVSLAATAVAVAGVVLNNRRRRACFLFWLISNGLTLVVHAWAALWGLALRDAIFLALAVEGFARWGRRP